jgi:membrane protease subunit (stomatin/prohibitin family)
MRRRVGRPGLVGTAARTAVIAGTATAVSGRVQRRQMSRGQQEAAEQQQQAAPPPPPAAAPATGSDDMITQLQKLGELHQQGILTDAEFAAQKAKLLG